MSNIGRIVFSPHAHEIDCLLQANGIHPEKWWDTNSKTGGMLLSKLLLCYRQEVSSNRFHPGVHNAVVKKKLDLYFKWLATQGLQRLSKK